MKVLWFSGPCGYIPSGRNTSTQNKGYNGGGWMPSMLNEIKHKEDIEIGVCFAMDGQPFKSTQNGITYYPIPNHIKKIKDKFLDLLYYNRPERDEILWGQYKDLFKQVISDFKPDIIEIFGSELYTGLSALVAKEMGVPCVLHLQGLLSLSIYIFLPTGVSRRSFIFKDSIKGAYANFQLLTYWERSCHREKAILNAVSHVIGRTEWDRHAMEILNPNAKHHYGGEILRPCFYEDKERCIPTKPVITTTSSGASYKGFDLVLKTANILKNECGLDFEWNVYGDVNPQFFEKLTGIKHEDVYVNIMGVASAEQLCDAMLNSTLYFQPSYVENSPNSVAEAQMMGQPVVATNVGGTASLVHHEENGFLFPATDPYMAAYYIMKIVKDYNLNIKLGNKGQEIAKQRHNRETIVTSLINTYNDVIRDDK